MVAKMAYDAREEELQAMDKIMLKQLCDKTGVNPFVQEIMVDRIVRQEFAAGCFARPVQQDEEMFEDSQCKKGDMVEIILAYEAQRKKDQEMKMQQKEALCQKLNELRAMTNEELKQALTKQGREPAGKKDDMVGVLCEIFTQEEAAAAK